MDKWEAQYGFWSSFGVPAYEENSVPDSDVVTFPYITYQAVSSHFDGNYVVNASIWTRSTSWLMADSLSNAIEARLKNGGEIVPYDAGLLWFTAEVPFSQNMGDPEDDRIKRKRLIVLLHCY